MSGGVSFVGAGPGAADLMTVRGVRRIGEADVVLWTPNVIDPTWIRENTRADAHVVNVSRFGDDEMHALYRRAASEKLHLARLHSGDPATWSWLRQHIDVCTGLGLEVETIPGVQPASAAAVSLGVSLTETDLTESVILSGVDAATLPDPARIRELAQHGTTMALVLPAVRAAELAEALRAGGFDVHTPVVVAYKVSWSDELVVQTTVEELVATVKGHRLWRHTLFLIGGALRPGSVKPAGQAAPPEADTARRRTTTGSATGSRWSARARATRRASTASPVPAAKTRRPGSKKPPAILAEPADPVNEVAAEPEAPAPAVASTVPAPEPETTPKSTVDEPVEAAPPAAPVKTTARRTATKAGTQATAESAPKPAPARKAAPAKAAPAEPEEAEEPAEDTKPKAPARAAAASKRRAPRSSATAKADTVAEEPTPDDDAGTPDKAEEQTPAKSTRSTKSTGRTSAKSKGKATAKSRTGSTKRGQSRRSG